MSETWRRPTKGQIAVLNRVRDGYESSLAAVARLVERGWVKDDGDHFPALTPYGQRTLDEAGDIEDAELYLAGVTDRPNVRLQKRTYNRSWLGWEVLCYAGCPGGHYGTRNCVWATNDHTARDKWMADVAFARHMLQHLGQPTSASIKRND